MSQNSNEHHSENSPYQISKPGVKLYKTLCERDHFEDSGVDGWIILKWIFRKWDGAWTRLL
jgi:hypothetical protein